MVWKYILRYHKPKVDATVQDENSLNA